MSWTIDSCRQFLRGVTAYPGIIKCGTTLDYLPRQRSMDPNMRTLADWDNPQVAQAFYDYNQGISGYRVDDFLNNRYWDDKGRERRIRQLGGHKSSTWGDKGLHLTQRSETLGDGRPQQYGHFVMEHEWGTGHGDNAAMLVTRNREGAAMASSRTDGVPHLVTAASFFATEVHDLIDGLNALLDSRDLRRLPPNPSPLDISVALYVINYHESPNNTAWEGNRAVSAGHSGKAEVAPLHIPGLNVVAASLNNVRSTSSGLWERDFYRSAIVAVDKGLVDRFITPQGWGMGPQALAGFESRGINLHREFYGALTRFISEGTGVGR